MRFLFTRRWVVFAVIVVLLAAAAWLLGRWQFHRLEERRVDNTLVARNLAAPPVPVDEVLREGRSPSAQDEWRRVTVHGTWDNEHSIVVKYQTSADGAPGVDIATPLITDSGTAVLVDRGWMSTENSGGTRPKVPPVTEGKVTVTGHVRLDGSGRSTVVDRLQTRAISSRTAAAVLPYKLYGGFLDLDKQSPPPVKALGAIELPDDTSEGPHFFYGLQWWFFGGLAIFGFGYLVYDEWRRRRTDRV